MTNRLVDYFGVIGVGRRLVLAEEPLFAEEVSLQQLSFKSSLLDRYPLEDYEDVPLSSELPLVRFLRNRFRSRSLTQHSVLFTWWSKVQHNMQITLFLHIRFYRRGWKSCVWFCAHVL